jgi:hypothetical protein
METYKEIHITLKLKQPLPKETLENPIKTAIEYFDRYNFEFVENYLVDYK